MAKHAWKLKKIGELKEWLADGTQCELNNGWACRTCSLAFLSDLAVTRPGEVWYGICEMMSLEKDLLEKQKK